MLAKTICLFAKTIVREDYDIVREVYIFVREDYVIAREDYVIVREDYDVVIWSHVWRNAGRGVWGGEGPLVSRGVWRAARPLSPPRAGPPKKGGGTSFQTGGDRPSQKMNEKALIKMHRPCTPQKWEGRGAGALSQPEGIT